MLKKILNKLLSINKIIIKKIETVYLYPSNLNIDYSLVTRNSDLVNKFENETCFIVGCGPSIKNQDLLKLRGKNVIGLSTFFHHESYNELNIIANVFTGYTYHKNNFDVSEFVKQYKDIRKYSKGLLFFHEGDSHFIRENKIFDLTDDIRFYKTKSDIENILKFKPSIDREIYAGQNIAVFGIQIAMSMGFKKIYLLGLDHDWIYKLPKKEYTKFESSKVTTSTTNAKTDFDVIGQDKFSFWVKVYSVLWSNYEHIKKYADANNISVVNITEGGILDVFERENFEDVVKQQESKLSKK